MKYFSRFIAISLLATVLFSSCKKDDDKDTSNQTGTVEFKTINPVAELVGGLKNNPALTGDTTVTHLSSLKIGIGDVWVSKGEVKAGQPDNLEWIRLTSVTNTDLKLFEDYQFSPVELPVGTYKSVKITFRNIFYRKAVLASDKSVQYELLETMGSSTDACDENDTTWARVNYFSTDGNHSINASTGLFELASEGEKVGGFTIEANKKASLIWRLGAGVEGYCTEYLIDVNGNGVWDCGIDQRIDECPAEMEYMWDFYVEYD